MNRYDGAIEDTIQVARRLPGIDGRVQVKQGERRELHWSKINAMQYLLLSCLSNGCELAMFKSWRLCDYIDPCFAD